ncbi:MAG: M28 family peptidase [Acidobacteria bacterium]|nr:M28 family peptidase [Acidobacteriota bacterium]
MRSCVYLLALISIAPALLAQDEPNPKTLLPQPVIDAMVNEASGSVALAHIMELAAYERDRLAEEYKTSYRESLYIERMAKQYGLDEVKIERFKLATKTWDGELGELWLLDPDRKRLLISYRDVAASLATGSKTSDVTTELVYVGRGEDKKDYVDRNVAGKIVLASGQVGPVHNLAVREFGAAGVVSFANATGKPIDRPDQIAWSGLSRGFGPEGGSQKTTFGIILSHRLGMELVELLQKRQTLQVQAKVRATEYEADMQVPTALIKGTSESSQEVVLTGHLFEGIAKQGALDDASGSAATLEVARAWMKLINDGVLPRPRRSVRFLWIPEIQGTRAYLERYPDEAKRMIAAISMDMVGEDVSKNRNSLRLMRTPYSVNSFINEVRLVRPRGLPELRSAGRAIQQLAGHRLPHQRGPDFRGGSNATEARRLHCAGEPGVYCLRRCSRFASGGGTHGRKRRRTSRRSIAPGAANDRRQSALQGSRQHRADGLRARRRGRPLGRGSG